MILTSGYTFTPKTSSAAGTIDFSGVSGFNPAQLTGVRHLPTGRVLYAPLASSVGTFSGSVLTLAIDTTGLSASDALQVTYANNVFGQISDAATTSGAATSIIGALRAIRDRLLATLAVTVTNRVLPFAPLLANSNLAASASAVTPERATGATSSTVAGAFCKYNVYVKAGDQPLTVNVLGRSVSNGTTFTLDTQTVAAGGILRQQYNAVFAVMLLQVVNGATATTGTYAADSLSAC